MRVLEIDESDETDKTRYDPDDGECHDNTEDDPPCSGGGTSHVNVLSSFLGSGLSPDHGCM